MLVRAILVFLLVGCVACVVAASQGELALSLPEPDWPAPASQQEACGKQKAHEHTAICALTGLYHADTAPARVVSSCPHQLSGGTQLLHNHPASMNEL